MANEQNLKKYSEMTPEEQREFHSKGGKISVEKRKERKTFAQIYKALLDEQNEITINGQRIKLSNKDILARKVITEVLKGTVNNSFLKGAEHIQATIGEAPIQKIEQTNFNVEAKPTKMDIAELKKIRKEVFDKE